MFQRTAVTVDFSCNAALFSDVLLDSHLEGALYTIGYVFQNAVQMRPIVIRRVREETSVRCLTYVSGYKGKSEISVELPYQS